MDSWGDEGCMMVVCVVDWVVLEKVEVEIVGVLVAGDVIVICGMEWEVVDELGSNKTDELDANEVEELAFGTNPGRNMTTGVAEATSIVDTNGPCQ